MPDDHGLTAAQYAYDHETPDDSDPGCDFCGCEPCRCDVYDRAYDKERDAC